MSNILQAVINIEQSNITALDEIESGGSRINNVGAALEMYVKHAFANTFEENDAKQMLEKHDEVFSYGGNANNIPDAMIDHGDAIEVKKIEAFNSRIPLNSSYPKDTLYADDHRINNTCRSCESWTSKDMIYAIGIVPKRKRLRHLWLIDGACYAAERETYTRIETTIREGVNSIPDIEFSTSKELGRVNGVDPLGITYLRIRGMWHIENPSKLYQHIYSVNKACDFSLVAILREEKYNNFPMEDREAIEHNDNVFVTKVKIKDPNNPVKLMNAMLISIEKA